MYLDDFVSRASAHLPEHKPAVEYLASRGFTVDDARKWGLGYTRVARIQKSSSSDWERLKDDTHNFRGLECRIIIPLRNIIGHVNGVQTRALDRKQYVQHLMSEAKMVGAFFGLFEALPSIRSTRRVFVHEGAFNAMAFARVFPNSVACLTSFLNEQQVELLRFIADNIIVVFDEDKAGDVGREKILNTYGHRGFEFVTTGVSDANACLKMMGPAMFERYVRSRVPKILQG